MNCIVNSHQELKDIPATLYIPLWARAKHTMCSDPVMEDLYAINILKNIDFDARVFEQVNRSVQKYTVAGVAARTVIFDNAVKEFINKYPDGLIINIGCGMDSRYKRLNNHKITWFDVDVEEAINLKRSYFAEEKRYKLLTGSILEPVWLNEIKPTENQKILLLSEGTLMYFDEEEIKKLFLSIIEKFSEAEFYFEAVGKWMKNKLHPTVKALGYNSIFNWAIDNYTDIESWHHKIKFVEAKSFYDIPKLDWGLWGLTVKIFPCLKNKFGSEIIHCTIG